MVQLSSVTSQNTANAEELSTGSEELASQAEQLREVMDFFIINAGIKSLSKNAVIKKQIGKTNRSLGKKLNLSKGNNDDIEFENF
jgi:methyl-accepting chemotaxis protein